MKTMCLGMLLSWKERNPGITIPAWLFKALLYLLVRKGHLVVDCGANEGHVLHRLLKTGADAIAFEPHPSAFSELKRRFGIIPGVDCRQKAVGARNETRTLYFASSGPSTLKGSVSASLHGEKTNIDPEQKVDVQTVCLSEVLQSLERRVRVLKIDIEGAEIEVLNDLLDTGAIFLADMVLVETHERAIPGMDVHLKKLRDRLQEHAASHVWLEWH